MRLDEQHIRCLLVAARNRRFIERAWLLDAMTRCSSYTHEIEISGYAKAGGTLELEHLKYPTINVSDVVRIADGRGSKFTGVVTKLENDLVTLEVLADADHVCFSATDVLDVPPKMVAEYFERTKLPEVPWGDTTVGRILVNFICLQYPFGFKLFTYRNSAIDPNKLTDEVSHETFLKHATIAELEKFFDYAYFIGHFTELATPSMSVKSLQTSPNVPAIKKKFIEEHKGQMDDPLVVQKLEKLLVEEDKKYLGDDESTVFFDGLGKSSYTLKRKKLLLTTGGIPDFEGSGGVEFIENSLMEGWTKEALPAIANESRRGSYDRGVETAKGGAETKLLMRAFQDATISEEDCGTKRTIRVDCSLFDGKQFIGRTIRVGNDDVVVTSENLDKFVTGKVIHLYSPLTCETKENFCYKCCGTKARELNARQLGVQTVKLTSKIMNISMKSMHGTTLEVIHNDLENILL